MYVCIYFLCMCVYTYMSMCACRSIQVCMPVLENEINKKDCITGDVQGST